MRVFDFERADGFGLSAKISQVYKLVRSYFRAGRCPWVTFGVNPRGANLSALGFADGSKAVGYLDLQVVGSSPILTAKAGDSSVGRAAECRKAYPTPILIRPYFSHGSQLSVILKIPEGKILSVLV